jgi:hypothetical protein
MKNEADPITDDEWLLRRVHKSRFKTNKTPIISPSAFEPRIEGRGRDPDIDGISLYREACVAAPEDILATVAVDKREDQGIVRIPVAALRQLNFAIDSKPDSQILGHVVIPDLNSENFASAKASYTPVLVDLARLASQDENIVRRPPSLG